MEVWIEVLTPKQALLFEPLRRMPKVMLYRALDPPAWLKRHHPKKNVLRSCT